VEQVDAIERRHHASFPRSEPSASGDIIKLDYAAQPGDPEEHDGRA
jgi:hypothetical protein